MNMKFHFHFCSFWVPTCLYKLLKTLKQDGLNREYAMLYLPGNFKVYKTGIKHVWKLHCPSQNNKHQEYGRASISGIGWAGRQIQNGGKAEHDLIFKVIW